MPSYDLDKIEEVGTTHAPALSDWYFDTLEMVDQVGRRDNNAFSDSLAPLWNDCYVFTYEVVYESAINLEAFGPSLVQVVESVQGTEGGNTDQFESLFEDTVSATQDVVAPEDYETLDDRIDQRADDLEEAAAGAEQGRSDKLREASQNLGLIFDSHRGDTDYPRLIPGAGI